MFLVKIFITRGTPTPRSGVFKGCASPPPTKIAKLKVYGSFYLRQKKEKIKRKPYFERENLYIFSILPYFIMKEI